MDSAELQPPVPPPADPQAVAHFEQTRGKLALWCGVLAAPIAWGVQLQLNYSLLRFACWYHWLLYLHHVTTLLLLGVAVWGTWLAHREWKRIGAGEPDDAEDPVPGRSRFMAVLGLLTGVLFCLLIVAQWIPALFFDPCEY